MKVGNEKREEEMSEKVEVQIKEEEDIRVEKIGEKIRKKERNAKEMEN